MARERWFYAHNLQRRGPVSLAQLAEAVLTQADPRATLIWRKGFAEWTRAEDVPEVERKIAPFLARKEAEEAARRAPAAARAAEAPVPVPAPPPAPEGSSALIYGGIGAGIVLALGVGAWLVWPRPAPPQVVPLGGETTESAPAIVIQAPASSVAATATPPPTPVPTPVAVAPPPAATPAPTPVPAALGDREADLPPAEVKKLRGVAAWEGTRLRLTVYNGTNWRVTELYARIYRFKGDDFTEDTRPVLLLPPARNVDAGVADLLSKVAPDRKKAGLNPLDTGPFEGEAGEQPESFRFEIESARGYPPR